jgi:type III restriction enzyme
MYKNHIFANPKGEFSTHLNGWEKEFLAWATKDTDFVCWLRNFQRRDWAFSIPYDLNGEKPFFPDFVIVRRKGTNYEVDFLEPHDDSRTDTWAKVKELAKFVDDHHLDFGRLIVGRKKDGHLQIVDVSDPETRKQARELGAPADLRALFERVA